jgi:REP element-mobilizing transposase RayT
MGSTLTNILIHVIFSTKKRELTIGFEIQEDLYRYINGIIKNEGCNLVVIGGVSDHVHMLIKIKPVCELSEMIKKIKGNSSRWINKEKQLNYNFSWQDGYGAFSVSESQVPVVVQYIKEQEKHHRKLSFKEEFIRILKLHGVEYDERYLW